MSNEIIFSRDWAIVPDSAIRQGSTLGEFLKDYQKIDKKKLNPACPTCVKEYIKTFKNYLMKKNNVVTENKSDYQLLKKRQNVILTFGSPIRVNNENITNEYAETLFDYLKSINEDIKLSDVFEVYPEQKNSRAKKPEPVDNDTEEEKAKKAMIRRGKAELLLMAKAIGIEYTEEDAKQATKEDIYETIQAKKEKDAQDEDFAKGIIVNEPKEITGEEAEEEEDEEETEDANADSGKGEALDLEGEE